MKTPEIILCQDCKHRRKVWKEDGRCRNGGVYICWCELNSDPHATNAVHGFDNEFCSSGVRKEDE